MMDSPDAILTPGEVADRMTILAIKRRRLSSAEARDHANEQIGKLEELIAGFSFPSTLIARLMDVNRDLWSCESWIRAQIRAGSDEAVSTLAKRIVTLNDERHALKVRIDAAIGVDLHEEKDYSLAMPDGFRDLTAPAYRLPLSVELEALRADLGLAEHQHWTPVLGEDHELQWTGIALRSKDGRVETLAPGAQYRDTDLMGAMLYVPRLLKRIHAPLLRVRFLALEPHQVIGWHADESPSVGEVHARLHAPIITDTLARVEFDHGEYQLSAGQLWFLDVSRRHRVINESNQRRVHLVIDCVANEWLCGILRGSFQ